VPLVGLVLKNIVSSAHADRFTQTPQSRNITSKSGLYHSINKITNRPYILEIGMDWRLNTTLS